VRIRRLLIDEVSYAYLDISNVKEPDVRSIDPNTLVFNMKTYSNLKASKGEVPWIQLYKTVNHFFQELSSHEQIRIARFYSNTHKKISNINNNDELIVFEKEASKELAQIFKDLDLANRITDFVKYQEDLLIPDLKHKGDELESAHHTKSMTFFYSEYMYCITISTICKMLSPIFGHMSNFITNSDIDNRLKDLHAASIISDLLQDNFPNMIAKIFNYVENGIGNNKKENDHTLSYHGNTKITLTILSYATILTKNFVNIDLYNKNIISDMYHCIDSKASNTINSNSRKSIVKMRMRPEDMKDDSESNKSRLETESYVSIAPIEVPLLVNLTTSLTIDNLLNEYGLSKKEFDENNTFYLNSPFTISPINMYIICTFIGHRIGGAHGISMLKYEQYSELLTFTQMYICNLNKHISEQSNTDDLIGTDIIHCLSTTDHGIKTTQTIIDNKIQIMANGSRAYRNCAELFPYAVGNVSWDSSLEKMVEYLTTRVHKYNTAPNICASLGIDDINNKELEYNELIMSNIFQFIYHSLKLVGHTNIFKN
jgi:hypothetical protein